MKFYFGSSSAADILHKQLTSSHAMLHTSSYIILNYLNSYFIDYRSSLIIWMLSPLRPGLSSAELRCESLQKISEAKNRKKKTCRVFSIIQRGSLHSRSSRIRTDSRVHSGFPSLVSLGFSTSSLSKQMMVWAVWAGTSDKLGYIGMHRMK